MADTAASAHPSDPPSRGLFAWALYDWASNAYATLIITFVFSAYFVGEVASDPTTGSVQWALALGITGVVVALGAPVFGATVDQLGQRKPWLACFTALCVGVMAALWFVEPDPAYVWVALLLIALGELCMEYAGVVYNAMLPHLAPPARIGRWSGWGWSMGYGGGLCCLVVSLLLFVWWRPPVFDFDLDRAEHIRGTFVFAAAWYALFAVPLFVFTPDVPATGKSLTRAARDGLGQLAESVRNVRRYRHVVRFLIARLIYIDGLTTVFMFGGVYVVGTFGLTPAQVLVFGIAINVTAGLGALGFARVDDWIGSRATILLALVGVMVPGVVMLLAPTVTWFWVAGLAFGVFMGPVQAASRSFMARAAPPALYNQMFGLYALSGKVAFVCPLVVGALIHFTDSLRIGMTATMVFVAVGFAIMLGVADPQRGR